MGLLKLVQEIFDKKSAVSFLQEKGILHRGRQCEEGHEMRLILSEAHDRWRCMRRSCRKTISLRKDTYLENSKVPFTVFVYFLYSWTVEYTTTKFCIEEFGMGEHTVTDMKNFLREVCADWILKHTIKIGGAGLTVEIYESLFQKRKYNVGKIYPEQWVFGGICSETRECFLYAVPDRTKLTLISVV